MKFWIEISSSTGIKYGELHNVSDWSSDIALDKAGKFSFTMPASDPKVSIVLSKRVAICYTYFGGVQTEIGAGVIDEKITDIDPTGNPTGTLTISGSDLLRELSNAIVGDLAIGPSAPSATGPADIIALAPAGWSLDTVIGHDVTLKSIQYTFEGETVLDAFCKLAELTGEHFRVGAGRKLVWLQKDHAASGAVALYNVNPVAIETVSTRCAITSISTTEDSYDGYVGRVYAIGSGTGDGKTTLVGGTVPAAYTGYAAGTVAGKGAYLENTSLWGTYAIEKYTSFKDIDNAQTLLEAAYEYLVNNSAPVVTYNIEVVGLVMSVYPGQTIKTVVHQYIDGAHTVNIDADMIVLESSIGIDNSGIRTVSMSVSASTKKALDETTAIIAGMGTSRDYYTHTQPVGGSDVVGALPAGDITLTGMTGYLSGLTTVQLAMATIDTILSTAHTWAAEQKIISTTSPQLRVGYDNTTNYLDFLIDTSFVVIQPSGAINLLFRGTAEALAAIFETQTTTTNAIKSVMSIRLASSGSQTDGAGPAISFLIQDAGNASAAIGSLSCVMDNGDHGTGRMVGAVYVGGTFSRRWAMDQYGFIAGTGILSTTKPDAPLHAYIRDAVTNAVSTVMTVEHENSGTAAAGVGARIALKLKSSTTVRQLAAAIDTICTIAAHATRTYKMVFSVILSAVETARMVIADAVDIGDIAGGNYTRFESDGTLVSVGNATTTDDIFMPVVPKTTGVGKPTLATFTGNINRYTFAVNDIAEIDTSELIHRWKEGSSVEFHVHWATNGNNDATVRGVKWEIDYTWANTEGAGGTIVFAAATTVSAETSIPANQVGLTHKYTSVVTITPTGGKIGAGMCLSLKRIASVTNVAPANNPFCLMVGAHIEQDTLGSRTTTAK
jgi:hypothetical protein